ncbi:hypothetical protein CMV_017333 [Castanea mollissima]|uniref:Secreted protein n=1 Tax=Castanea mollissima TaxID=60419 RepID=A0A8J4R5V4_9ROSI|nr:hypothetical protein CMV_017333 [Castanea mollissima]
MKIRGTLVVTHLLRCLVFLQMGNSNGDLPDHWTKNICIKIVKHEVRALGKEEHEVRPGLDLGLRLGSSLCLGLNLGLHPDLGHNGARQSRPSSRSWPQWSSPILVTVLVWVC